METVCVFGVGYVGSEVARLASNRGFRVTVVDSNPDVVSEIRRDVRLSDVEIDCATTDGSAVIEEADVIVCAVPTPLDTSYAVNLEALESVTETVSTIGSDRSPLYVIESTVPPGTTEDIVVPILDDGGLMVGEDIHVAHVPERIDPGSDDWPVESIPRVAGAMSEGGLERVVTFYESLLDATIHAVDTPSIAEASKIVENTYRDINIAYVNEIAMALDRLGIDTKAVLDAAATKPFGFSRFSPGVGVGGHCIPVDPYFLISEADTHGFNNRFLKYSRDINDGMPVYVAQKTIRELNAAEILPNGARVLLLGQAFKPNVNDVRNSPYFKLKSELEQYGVVVETYDPHVPDSSTVESPYVPADGVVLITAHEDFSSLSFERLAENDVRVFVDGRNIYDPDTVTANGIRYAGVGR